MLLHRALLVLSLALTLLAPAVARAEHDGI